MTKKRINWGLVAILMLALLLVACSGPNSETGSAAGEQVTSTPPPTQPPPDQQTPVNATSTSSPTATEEPTPEPTATSEPSATPALPFPDQVAALLGDPAGFYAVVVEALDGSFSYALNSDEQVESASLYKLPIMVEIFRQREAGELDFSTSIYMDAAYFHESEGDVYDDSFIGSYVTVDELMTDMITLSSNVAAYALLDLAGMENINATMANIGLTSTEIRWEPVPLVAATHGSFDYQQTTQRADEALNVTTAGDTALLFKMLTEGSLISPEASQEMYDLLAHQGINDRLPALLPDGTIVAHKTGNLPGEVVHDAGVIEAPATPVVVVVLTEGADEGVAYDFMQQLALLAFERAS